MKINKAHAVQALLAVTKNEYYRTIAELSKQSQPHGIYLVLLTLSAVVTTSGILLNNVLIIMAGLVMAPVFTPLLVMALAVIRRETKTFKNAALIIVKSASLVIGIAGVLSLIFGGSRGGVAFMFENSLKTGVIYCIVALIAGVATTFAWVRKESFEIFSGVAIAVSLLLPLSIMGVSLSIFDMALFRFAFMVSIFNFLGIVTGGILVFTLLRVYKNEKNTHTETE